MGRKLIIKGADFSANSITEELDITAIVAASDSYQAQYSLAGFHTTSPTSNAKRCCVKATLFSTWGINVSKYSKLEVVIKSGYDYVFGTGQTPGVDTNWQGWSGTTGGQTFSWVTGNQKAVATLGENDLAMSLNLRYDDNTTEFSASTALTDIVESIKLIP